MQTRICNNLICTVGSLLLVLAASGCGRGNQNSEQDSFGGKLVTVDIPKQWILQKHQQLTNSEAYQFLIPDAATEGTSDSANAVFTIEKAPEGLNITNLTHQRLTSSPGFATLATSFVDGKWCTALTRGQQTQTPYIIMDRLGVDQGVIVLFRLAHPILTNNSAALANSISTFNGVVRSLRIGGTNAVNSEIRKDADVIWLREFSDSDTNWMISPTNKPIYRIPQMQ